MQDVKWLSWASVPRNGTPVLVLLYGGEVMGAACGDVDGDSGTVSWECLDNSLCFLEGGSNDDPLGWLPFPESNAEWIKEVWREARTAFEQSKKRSAA